MLPIILEKYLNKVKNFWVQRGENIEGCRPVRM
jgi:hypothetical protein